MRDKRLTHLLTDYWNQLREEHPLPEWEKFNQESFKELWRQCCGWKVDTATSNTIVYTYEHIGESLKKVAGDNRIGKKVTSHRPASGHDHTNIKPGHGTTDELLIQHFDNFPAARILQKIDRTVQKPAIVIEEGRVTDGEGNDIRFRSCLLPFGDKEGVVSHMVLGLSWKKY
jgi:hypothetical protein